MTPTDSFAVTYLRTAGASAEEEERVKGAASKWGATFQAVDCQPLECPVAPAMDPGDGRLVIVGSVAAVAAVEGPPPGACIVVLAEAGDFPDHLAGSREWLAAVVRRPVGETEIAEAIRRAGSHVALLTEVQALRRRAASQGHELKELNRIGVALSAERDIDALLSLILSKCREITTADAGSLYLVVPKKDGVPDEKDYLADKEILFRLAQNDSVNVPFCEFRMDISRKSLAGFVVQTGELLAIDDAYRIPADREYSFNRSYDESSGYRTRSLLVIPMRNHKDEVIGALQLINRKREGGAELDRPGAVDEQVIPFDDRTSALASSLASQAAVAIENARLYQEIQVLFEGFIRASVAAIESRDPTTSGHSERVAKLTVGLAKRVGREDSGPLGPVNFSRDDIQEIRYASLLHDFGKIGVRENVLVKGKKLYPYEVDAVKRRFWFIRRSLELKYTRRKIAFFGERSREDAVAAAAVLDAELAEQLERLERYLQLILESNEPTVLKKEASSLLEEIAATSIEGMEGESFTLLEPREASNLKIVKGSLSPEERREIESHVKHTFDFLSTIPWTRELSQVPRIAGAHHEKLDGSGYPRGVDSAEIPLQSRIMTISDIFDALTARDRPYKKAIPTTRALDILSFEVKEGKLDPELFRIFVEGKVYELAFRSDSPRPA
jgi:HD-GYP domain-containing protein (c-di-GMP phosphodiesterase class II)